ncbi:FISUMP domain-containing protein [Dysgonomonas sp. ZJ279]|uniref:FISUMP domain-containing protein n=1 Tax=Dysgonomonas sp. ZJ279 TaxID=2709796 RepID=UPI0013EA36C1|nr:FISUMP domain-containing protein [Dysgonomonas sp. ZJ279]
MMQKHIRVFSFMVVLSTFTNVSLSAQVTIGSNLPPKAGTLLDLNEFSSDAQNANSTRGLQLPRVSLTDLNSLTDIAGGGSALLDAESLTGLWVYNAKESSDICPGLHVWSGSQWTSLMPSVVEYFEDVRTKANGSTERIVYPARTFGKAGTWMLENLRATTYADNLGVNKATNDIQITVPTSSTTLKAAYYPNIDKAAFDQNPRYGMLYTFAAATNGKTTVVNEGESSGVSGTANPIPGNVEQVGAQGICPEGWHVPSDKEWSDLEEVMANEQTGLYTVEKYKPTMWNSDGQNWRLVLGDTRNTTNGHGASMKTAFVKVNNEATTGKSASYCRGGLNLLVVGVINDSGKAIAYGGSTNLWTNSAFGDSGNAYVRGFARTTSGVTRIQGSRSYGYAVRCKKN